MEQSFSLFPLVFMLICAGVGLLTFCFWIWALVDCLTKEPSKGNDKIIWILVIVLLGLIGALVYVFVRRPQRIREVGN